MNSDAVLQVMITVFQNFNHRFAVSNFFGQFQNDLPVDEIVLLSVYQMNRAGDVDFVLLQEVVGMKIGPQPL